MFAVTVRVSRSNTITHLVVTRTVSAIAELLVAKRAINVWKSSPPTVSFLVFHVIFQTDNTIVKQYVEFSEFITSSYRNLFLLSTFTYHLS